MPNHVELLPGGCTIWHLILGWLLDAKNSQEKEVNHLWMILPLLCTFMLGPVGVLIYTLVLLTHKKLFAKTT